MKRTKINRGPELNRGAGVPPVGSQTLGEKELKGIRK